MAKETADEALARLKKNRRNHSVEEWLHLLDLQGWTRRAESKTHYALKRGTHTLTVQKPHGKNKDKGIPIKAAATIIREIEAANLEAKTEAKDEAKETPNDE